jgi:transposase
MSIPGVSRIVADVLLAETGGDMSVFATAAHLASWAGTAPGCNESAGRVKSTKTRHGNRYLKNALGTAAMAASRSKGTYFSAKYRRIAGRRGPMKALVASRPSTLERSTELGKGRGKTCWNALGSQSVPTRC